MIRSSLIGAAALAASASAAVEHLSMDALPSAHGWSFVASNVARTEGQTASVVGGMLAFDTMGSGHQPGGSSIHYTKTISPNWSQSWFIEARVRLDAFESFSNFHGVYFGAAPLWVGLSPTRLTFPDLTFVTHSPGAAFHTYRFEVQTSQAWTFYVDNVAVKTGVASTGSGTLGLRLGDGTGGSNGAATYDYFTFAQPIPAPAGACAIAGFAAAGAARRRRSPSRH